MENKVELIIEIHGVVRSCFRHSSSDCYNNAYVSSANSTLDRRFSYPVSFLALFLKVPGAVLFLPI